MLKESDAYDVVKAVFPGADIRAPIDYNGLYIFQVFGVGDVDEFEFDPFYSVNQRTGEVRDFSIITDGDTNEINRLFLEKQNLSRTE